MKKKVIFLIRDLNYGGAQRQLVTLVKALHQEIPGVMDFLPQMNTPDVIIK
ncbi:hypothetical protein Q5692_23335 [Microcoleus sp. C2C3]|uniref:hypothetical protein n=1 Tax=unclassified Microcoleus TaxID=2642155 RepID=UPI002FCFA0BE